MRIRCGLPGRAPDTTKRNSASLGERNVRPLSAGEAAFDQRRHVAFLMLQGVRAVALLVFPRLGSAEIKVTGDDMGVELRRADGGVIAVEVVGEPGATPVLFCHGLADSGCPRRGSRARPTSLDCVS
jgi:hypothetical protein